MLQIGISDIGKNPSIIETLDDMAEIWNKKTKQVKGIFIPIAFMDQFKEIVDEIEYRKFVERNRSLMQIEEEESTLLDGLDSGY